MNQAAAALPAAANAWHLPPLREDLNLLPGACAEDGSPTWMVYDALRHRYFKIGLDAFALLARWRTGLEAQAFVADLQRDGVDVDADDLKDLAHFLVANQLTQADSPAAMQQLKARQAAGQHGWFTWLLHHYLFVRVPLWRPDPFLARTLPWVAPLGSRGLQWLVRLLGLVGVGLVLRQWEQFTTTFQHFFSWEGLALYGLTLLVVKSAHELGHAYSAKALGCRVASMGVAFLVLVPVLYTDTTDAWRLTQRRDRLRIVTAGVALELHLALLATFAWSFLPDGPLRSAAFFVATTSWVTTLMVNLSPFMRFDGYFALCDLLGAENLQPRAFAMARWRLREALFGLGDDPPETLAPGRRLFFIAYAYATWLYRLSLFIGIALLVYHFTFKLLGIVLFAVEIGWFVMRPLMTEFSHWWTLRGRLRPNLNLLTTVAALGALGAALVVPWRPTIAVPAVLEAGGFRQVYPPERARLTQLLVQHGQHVAEGDLLARLDNPSVDQALQQARRRLELLTLRVQRRAGSEADLKNLQTLEQQHGEEQARVAALLKKQRQLDVRAPMAGTVTLSDSLEPGQWVEASAKLVSIRSEAGARVVGYLAEADLQRVAPGATGLWIANFGAPETLATTLTRVDTTAAPTLPYPELASDHGGPIAARATDTGGQRPETALYRVELALDSHTSSPPQRLPGIVRLQGKPRSLWDEYLTAATAVLIREGNF